MFTNKKTFNKLTLLLYFIKFIIMISKGTIRSLIIGALIAFLFGLARKN